MIAPNAPDSLLLTAYLSATVVYLLLFIRTAIESDSKKTVLGLALLWSVFCLIVQVVLLGLPHHWSPLSLVGKLLAVVMANFMVLAAAGWMILLGKKREQNTLRCAIVSFSIGLLAIGPSIIVGIFLSCAFTNDCV